MYTPNATDHQVFCAFEVGECKSMLNTEVSWAWIHKDIKSVASTTPSDSCSLSPAEPSEGDRPARCSPPRTRRRSEGWSCRGRCIQGSTGSAWGVAGTSRRSQQIWSAGHTSQSTHLGRNNNNDKYINNLHLGCWTLRLSLSSYQASWLLWSIWAVGI